jgi:chromosome segregation ATPase
MTSDKRRSDDNGSKYPTWKWMAITLSGILILLTGYIVGGGMSESKTELKLQAVRIEINGNRITALETNYNTILTSLTENRKLYDRLDEKMSHIENKLDAQKKPWYPKLKESK